MKYVIHPGKIISQRDGDVHYLSFGRLIRLYALNPRDCICATDGKDRSNHYPKGVIHLYPDYCGDYRLKK